MNVNRLTESLGISCVLPKIISLKVILLFNVKENVIAQKTSDAHSEFLMLIIVGDISLFFELLSEMLRDTTALNRLFITLVEL